MTADEFADAMTAGLKEYSAEKTEKMKKGIKKAAEEVKKTMTEIENLPFKQHTGSYVNHFAIKKQFENKYNIGYTWHVRDPEYPLTHLLEYGHRVVTWGVDRNTMTKKYPHIHRGEEIANKVLEELIKEL